MYNTFNKSIPNPYASQEVEIGCMKKSRIISATSHAIAIVPADAVSFAYGIFIFVSMGNLLIKK